MSGAVSVATRPARRAGSAGRVQTPDDARGAAAFDDAAHPP